MSTLPMYTISEFAKKFMSPSQYRRAKEHIAELNRQTPEEREAERRESKREERALRSTARNTWRQATEWRVIARKLGVRRITVLSERFRGFQADYFDGVIRINVYQSSCEEGLSEVFAHELGHHIDCLAHGTFSGSDANTRFITAFKRAGFRASPMIHLEMVAEILGRYLCGHSLNTGLLAEVRKILAQLPRPKARLINEFRRAQIRRVKIAA